MKVYFAPLALLLTLLAVAAPPLPPASITIGPGQTIQVTNNVITVYTNLALRTPTMDIPEVTAYSGLTPSMTLAWNRNTEVDIGGYILYYATLVPDATNTFKTRHPITSVAFFKVLDTNATYRAWVTATNTSGLESGPSNVILFQGR